VILLDGLLLSQGRAGKPDLLPIKEVV